MVGQVTGGDPSVTGVYYDASYNHSLLPPGTTTCPHGAPTGTVVNYDESIDQDSDARSTPVRASPACREASCR